MTLSTSKRTLLLLATATLAIALLSACGRSDTTQITPARGVGKATVASTAVQQRAGDTQTSDSNGAQTRPDATAPTVAASQLPASPSMSNQTLVPAVSNQNATPETATANASPLPHAPISPPIAGCGAASHPPSGCPPP